MLTNSVTYLAQCSPLSTFMNVICTLTSFKFTVNYNTQTVVKFELLMP